MSDGGRRYRAVAERLRAMIEAGRWGPEGRLAPERELAEELDAPRATLREALVMLEVEGVVEVRRNAGVFVTDRAAAPASPTAEIGPFELLRARQAVESAVAAEAASRAEPADLAAMRAALELEDSELAEGGAAHEGDAAFHHALAEATHNAALIACVDTLWTMRAQSRLWRQMHARIFEQDYRSGWRADHREIYAAAAAGDRDGARAAMWRHLSRVQETLMALTDADGQGG